jgi:hypothetical protein
MPCITIGTTGVVRAPNMPLHNFSVLANVSKGLWDSTTQGNVERSQKAQTIVSEWSKQPTVGINSYFKRHNAFKDQEQYNFVAMDYVRRHGTIVRYYVSEYDPTTDPVYHEDVNMNVNRSFDLPLILTFQPESELFNKFGIQALDEFEVHCQMLLFLAENYNSLRRAGIQPACDPSLHNPVWYQRGYENFAYYGYTAAQMFPKAGDYIKIEAFNKLYMIESLKDAAPEFEFSSRKYWWKLFLTDAVNDGTLATEDVIADEKASSGGGSFINNVLNGGYVIDANTGETLGDPNWPFDITCALTGLKKDVLFHAKEVPKDVPDGEVSCNDRWYACPDLFGKW